MIIVQFNEAILNLLQKYSDKYNFQNLKKITSDVIITSSEKKYENLEPWIQWTSFYSAKSVSDHKVLKLGDYRNDNNNLFKKLADQGKKIGIFCSMNQFYYSKFNFYVPDPWSTEQTDGTFISSSIKKITNLVVNRNSQLAVPKSLLLNLIYLVFFLPFKKIFFIGFNGFIKLIRKDRASLAGLLDYFLFNIVLRIHKKYKLDITSIFLNGLAHVQHHYLYNSEFIKKKNPSWYINDSKDPMKDILNYYEKIFANLYASKEEFIIITGLGQKILEEPEIYWRFKDHQRIFDTIFSNIKQKCVPKMSRDFYIYFDNYNDAQLGKEILENVYYFKKDLKLNAFGYLEINGKSLFGSLLYDLKDDDSFIFINEKKISLKNEIDFVAIKNSIHHEDGWAHSDKLKLKNNRIPIWDFSNIIFEKLN